MMKMELKSRLVHILNGISESENGKSIEDFLEELDITKRTFYYDLEKINEWLSFYKLGKTIIVEQKVTLIIFNKNEFDRKLSKTEGYYFSVEERRAMEFLYIALSFESVTIDKLREFFDVSKNTILTDIKEWKKDLVQWNISIFSSIKTGYGFEGEEAGVRKVIGRQLQILSNPGPRAIAKQILKNSLVKLTGNDIDFFEISRCVIKQYEKDIQGELFLSEIDMECMLIQVSWIRSMKGYRFDMSSDEKITLMNTASYRSLKLSLQKLILHNMEIPFSEIFYLIPLFLGIKTADFISQEQEDTYIMEFSMELVKNFERVSCISFVDKERLCHRLSIHVRPLYYRLKYGVVSSNPLVENIKNMYPYVYEFTGKALRETNSELSLLIVEDELAYLCVYFASHLNQKKIAQYSGERKNRVLIVGESNMAVSILIQEQLVNLFSDSLIYEKAVASRTKDWMMDDYVLIVTTIPLKNHDKHKNVVLVEPFMKDISRQKIINILEESGAVPKYNEMIRKVISITEKNCTGEIEKEQLYFDLFRFFHNEEHSKLYMANQGSILREIEKGGIICFKESQQWRELLEAACKKFQGKYYHRSTYERLQNLLLHKKGKIYKISEDVIIVRCPMQGAAHSHVEVCVCLSKEGVIFPDGLSGKIVLFLSTIDNYSHWSLLREIYDYFGTKEHVNGILENYYLGDE